MARQKGPIYLRGTAGKMTYYRMGGRYYVRRKTSLDKERFYQDEAFTGSRKAAGLFGVASKIASEVYKMLPQKQKGHGVIGRLSGKANRLLHAGKCREEVFSILCKEYWLDGFMGVQKKAFAPQKIHFHTVESLLEELTAPAHTREEICPFYPDLTLPFIGPMVPT
jgi:hypothetical protein